MKVRVVVAPASRMLPPIEVEYAGDIYAGVGPTLRIRDGVLEQEDIDALQVILGRSWAPTPAGGRCV